MNLRELGRDVVRLAKQRGADQVAVAVSRSTEVSLTRRAGKLEQASQATSLGVSLSLLVDDRYSVHSTSDLRPDALGAFLDRAIAATRVLEPEPERRLPDPELCGRSVADEVLDASDPGWEAVTSDQRREHAERLEACIDALPERGRIKSATVYVGDSTSETARVSSNGFDEIHGGTGFGHGAEMTLEEPGGKRPEGYAFFSTHHRADLPGIERVAADCWTRTAQRLASGPTASGRYPLLLENHAAGRILGVLGGPLAGSELHQGRSFLAGKLGTAIGSSALTLLDEPFLPRALGSRAYDGEGLRARPFPVIEAGILRNYYINVYYGRKLGMPFTSGGRSNWVVPPGPRAVADIVRDLPRCIVVTGFLGGNSNGLTGDFSFGVQGMLLEHGEVVKNLSEMNVSGNLADLFHKYAEPANDVWTFSGVRSPSLLFEDVEFSGT